MNKPHDKRTKLLLNAIEMFAHREFQALRITKWSLLQGCWTNTR